MPSPTDIASSGTGPSVSSVFAKNGLSAELKELRSEDGRFRFVVEDDGSLVLYMDSDAIWAIYAMSACAAHPDERAKLVLQNDGNMVVLLDTRGCIWSSNTANTGPTPFRLTMQNDGNCALYDGRGTERWCTRTMGWG